MTPVSQLTRSDCTRACLASIFDLPIEQVPPLNGFNEDEYHEMKRAFLTERGLALIDVPLDGIAKSGLHYMSAKTICMVSVASLSIPERLHHVVGCLNVDHAGGNWNLDIIHDPQGLRPEYPEPTWVGLFVPLKPSP